MTTPNQTTPSPDTLDFEILKILVRNSRLGSKGIGMLLNRSKSVIAERINRMEANGIIKNYVAIADHKKLNSLFISCILVRVKDHSSQALDLFKRSVSDFEEVLECLHITGHFDFYIKAVVEHMASFNYFLTEKLGYLPNLAEVKSLPVIDEVKREVLYPVFN